MSTDRELLELAAKAAGIRIEPVVMRNVRELGDEDFIGYRANPDQCQRGWFNPLTDDSDALRLAGALLLAISIDSGYTRVIDQNEHVTYEKGNGMVTTRRAIVRAAAEIGRTMP